MDQVGDWPSIFVNPKSALKTGNEREMKFQI